MYYMGKIEMTDRLRDAIRGEDNGRKIKNAKKLDPKKAIIIIDKKLNLFPYIGNHTMLVCDMYSTSKSKYSTPYIGVQGDAPISYYMDSIIADLPAASYRAENYIVIRRKTYSEFCKGLDKLNSIYLTKLEENGKNILDLRITVMTDKKYNTGKFPHIQRIRGFYDITDMAKWRFLSYTAITTNVRDNMIVMNTGDLDYLWSMYHDSVESGKIVIVPSKCFANLGCLKSYISHL